MAGETKIVKGGFRATLALIISIIALVLSIMAYTSMGKEEDLRARIKDLQTKMESMKHESSKQIDKLRGETSDALERLSNAVKKKEPGE
ncbi:MAG: hypothetical protein JSW56_11970 [Deltaproteobacteria bacterium]|nr:MAG: hypothetical protein JSW56_11970 [Deltaproteobacteria bacterium]